MLDLLCERPGSYVLSTSDLSPGALTCAVLIFVFSGAHMYLWNRLQNILWLTVGLVLSTVSFSVWKYWKEQPQSAYWYILALAVPGVHGLCVEVRIHCVESYARLKHPDIYLLAIRATTSCHQTTAFPRTIENETDYLAEP